MLDDGQDFPRLTSLCVSEGDLRMCRPSICARLTHVIVHLEPNDARLEALPLLVNVQTLSAIFPHHCRKSPAAHVARHACPTLPSKLNLYRMPRLQCLELRIPSCHQWFSGQSQSMIGPRVALYEVRTFLMLEPCSRE